MNKPNQDDNPEVLRMRDLLRQSEQQIDPFTMRRLRAARARAVEQHKRSWWSLPRRFTLPALAASLAIIAAVKLQQQPPSQPPVSPTIARAAMPNLASSDGLDALMDDEGPQFYEDLELIMWLDSGQHPPGQAQGA